MDAEIAKLETKLVEVLDEVARLRADNAQLRSRVGELEKDNKILSDKVRSAVTRVESALAKLPASEEK